MKYEVELSKLKEIIAPLLVGAMPSKIRYANQVMDTLITELNFRDLTIDNLKAKIAGMPTKEYLIIHEKYRDILYLMGAISTTNIHPIDNLHKENLRWICENNETQPKPLTFTEIWSLNRAIDIFRFENDRLPNDYQELKDFYKKGND